MVRFHAYGIKSEDMYSDTGDAQMVVDVAVDLRTKINELDFWGRFCDNLLEETFWASVGYAKKAAIKKLDLTPSLFVQSVKTGLKLTAYIGNNVFNVSERHDIANNIRYVSYVTTALRYRIYDAEGTYSEKKTEEAAKIYMQLISYLLDARALGESQVAAFGMTYEVLPSVFDSKDLFLAVKEMSGAENVCSWVEWRDVVEDRISRLRVQLLKNPVTQQVGDICAPVVTFDYAAGQTADGYRVEGLDNSRQYEVTFSNEAISYDYGDSLRTAIPAGSYSYDYATKDSYDYVYIRSVADANRFASYVYRAPVYPMAELTVAVAAGHGVITGAGRYEYGSQAVLVATPNNDYEFAGWYDENGQLLGSETTLTLTLTGDRCISASFSRVKADWHEDPETGLATGFAEKLSVDEVTAYYAKLGRSASITGANGESVTVVATGCLLTLDGQTYSIVVSGDTNGDGSVSVLDVECLYTFLTQSRNVGSVTNEACFRSAVDVNSDGAVDVYDLQLLYETVSGSAKT